MKWQLFLALAPGLLQAQILLETQSLEWAETKDTLSLNTITPAVLWSQFHIPKNAVFSFIEYRKAMGYLDHYDELYTLKNWDSTLVAFIREALPLNRSKNQKKAVVQSFVRWTPNRWSLQTSLHYQTEHLSAAIHRRISDTQHTFPAAVARTYRISPAVDLLTIVGAHKITAGQGLLLGASSFPSLASSEIFSRGIQLKTGAGNYAHEGLGAAAQLKIKNSYLNYSYSDAHSHRGSAYLQYSQGRIGIAADTSALSVFYKLHLRNFRYFAEHTIDQHAVGCNVFISDVLFEYNLYHNSEGFTSKLHMNWRDRRGNYFLTYAGHKLRLVHQGKRHQLSLSEHLHEHRSTYRWRYQFNIDPNKTLELHYHQGTRGIALRERQKFNAWEFEGAIALIEYHGFPVWFGHPVASGNIGATGVFNDYAGIHLRMKFDRISVSAHWNLLDPSQPQLKVSSRLVLS